MNAPGMHSSGPRPKSHCGSPVATSLPTSVGGAQFRCAVPAGELPVGWQWTPSCWFAVDVVAVRARRVRVRDDELLIVERTRVVVLCDDEVAAERGDVPIEGTFRA